jgi:hypothetical protein
MHPNVDKFLASQQRYFSGSYDQFLAFGGPCVYFHKECTIRFFSQSAEKWMDSTGKFKAIQLPKDLDDQFRLFHATCIEIRKLASQVDPSLFRQEREQFCVSGPKALDNAIVNYVRITASELRQARLSQT